MAKIRIKNHWFRDGAGKTPEQNASAMAFITWRVAQNTIKQMRSARFDVEVGTSYFALTREILVFLIQVIDRLSSQHMDDAARQAFVTALVLRLADVLQDNANDLLGPPPHGQASHANRFIDLYNELADAYAEFGFQAQEPDFAFTRFFGSRIAALMSAKDQRWTLDQIMACEAPEALDMIRRGLAGVLETTPRSAHRPPRGVLSGE